MKVTITSVCSKLFLAIGSRNGFQKYSCCLQWPHDMKVQSQRSHSDMNLYYYSFQCWKYVNSRAEPCLKCTEPEATLENYFKHLMYKNFLFF